jgi:glucose-6-phosphate isomerase
MTIKLNTAFVHNQIPKEAILKNQEIYLQAKKQLINKTGAGNDFCGWLDLPEKTNTKEFQEIKQQAAFLSTKEVVVVIGIGGSYLGAKAIIEAFLYESNEKKAKTPEILFAGHHIGEEYHSYLLNYLVEKDYACIVISKSGTTTEPAIAFRLIKKQMQERFPNDIKQRIIAITDKEKGSLKQLADKEFYKSFIIPDDVGGRYSVLSPVGLLPIAAAGIDIEALLQGAAEMKKRLYTTDTFEENPALYYAAIRNYLYDNNYSVELLCVFEPQLFYFMEWWKQLFGESDGKENKGLFPASAVYSTDLHSLGQFVQQGSPCLFESLILIENKEKKLCVPEDEDNLDKLNYLKGKTLHEINKKALQATALAHKSRNMPLVQLSIPEINAYYLGQMIFFFEFACAVGAYANGINPFDQPGVEAYKENMFILLGKEGYTDKSI